MTPLIIIGLYLLLLLGLGLLSTRFFRGTARDYFLASHSIGPFLLLMSVFGTTMTAFALVGSTGEAYVKGIGVYGLMASWSGLVHSAGFFLIGIRFWAFGKRYGYVTQCQFFRDRFESNAVGSLLFPILVSLVVPYLLIGLLGAGTTVAAVTRNTLPAGAFFATDAGGLAPWLTSGVICLVVLTYVFFGGLRGTAWANTFQTLVFMVMGLVAFFVISSKLGGLSAAIQTAKPERLARVGQLGQLQFISYFFIPLSVGMFPHLFQHWLTAKSARTFRATVVLHPICIMVVWVPCVLMGVWATGGLMPSGAPVITEGARANAVLGIMVAKLTNPILTGLLTAGILAAIMSSLDSQFLCIGTMFTNDVVIHHFGEERFNDGQRVLLARGFICAIVLVTYLLSLLEPRSVFQLGVWCFSGFASLFPIAFAAAYWKRVTKAGVIASILVTAAVWSFLFYRSDFGANRHYLVFFNEATRDGLMPVSVIFAASAITLVVISLVTCPPSSSTIEKFFPQGSGEATQS